MSQSTFKQCTLDGIMFIVQDPTQARHWYSSLFQTQIKHLPEFSFDYLEISSCIVEFLQADHKNQPGTQGQVGYWSVPSFDEFIERAYSMGATLYRGPIKIEEGRRMAQLKDPFGNLIGIRGV